MDIRENISLFLLKAIHDTNLTISLISSKTGISRARLYCYINKTHLPTLYNLKILAQFFGVSTNFICGFEEENDSKLEKKVFKKELIWHLEKIKQNELASKINVSPAVIVKWKNGAQPTLENLICFCNLFSYKLSDFL